MHMPPDASVREVPKWVRRYAQNRTTPMLLQFVAFATLFAGIAGFSYLAGRAYRAGQYGHLVWFVALDVMFVVANIFFSVPRWGGAMICALDQRLGAQEGRVELRSAKFGRGLRWVGVVFCLCVVGSVIADFSGLISPRLVQPVSALYVVPFLTFLIFVQRPKTSYILLIWPALYVLHAISILAGAPPFSGRWEILNMLLPTLGYGFLSAVVAQIYSRYALLRLKRLMKVPVSAEGDRNA